METSIRVLSLNCWGLKFIAKNRVRRIQAIANELAVASYDIISLQEIWVFADYEHVRDAVSKRLPYSKFFYSGALGAGLAIFSRFPIMSTSVHSYSLNGEPMDVIAGDWFVGKAAASILIHHPVLGEVQIFNTHFFAKGGEEGPEYKRAHRLVNAWEFSKLVRQAAEMGRYVIAAGDFNSIPSSLPITIIRDHAALTDSWATVHPDGVGSMPAPLVPTPEEALARFGVTADSPVNSYSRGKPLDAYARRHWGKRLDYIFYRQPKETHEVIPTLRCTQCNVVLSNNIPGAEFSFSDHFGLESVIDIIPAGQPASPSSSISDLHGERSAWVRSELSGASITSTMHALASCHRFSRSRSRRELFIFVLCLFVLVAIIVGTVWLPHTWLNPVFLLFTIFIAWLGTTMLYSGFLYGNWECNALMNVIEELEIHQKALDIQAGIDRA